jgi:polyisoprenoid-binding protein YceI
VKILTILFALSIGSSSFAGEIKISEPSFEAAEKSENYFKFIGHSRKLGIIGTSFEGYARSATLTFEEKNSRYEKVVLRLPVLEIDTDNSSRNEKMWHTCLSAKEFPEISVVFSGPIDLALGTQEIPATMNVRGESVPLQVKITRAEDGRVKGTSSFKLSAAKIPDPSILFASVRDEFEIEFSVR